MRLITTVKRLLKRDPQLPTEEKLREEAATSEGMPPAAVSKNRSR
jgi:hypothetical protein